MKHLHLYLLALPCLFSMSACSQRGAATDKIVVAYVTAGATIMPDPAMVTHINYAFGSVNATFNGVNIGNPDRLKTIVALKEQSPTLKVQLSIGGWTSGRFSEMAGDSTTRRAFAQDCGRIVAEYKLDGIDMDWEYPTSSEADISSSPDDTRNFTLLMHDLRTALGPDKLLTLASVASAKYVDFRGILDVIDFVNVMTYDVGRPPHHHSGLFRSEHTGRISTAEAVQAHIDSGVPANRLTMGVPFYGHGVGAIPDFIDYKDIIHLKGYDRRWDDVAKVPYLTDSAGTFACCYEDAQSIAHKCRHVADHNLLGLMYWEYSCDDPDGTLRQAVRNVLGRR